MREYTQGSIRRKKKTSGVWEWYGEVSYMENGKQRRVGHFLGVACDDPNKEPKEDNEGEGEDKPKRKRGDAPRGKGSSTALSNFKTWRDSLIEAERDREERERREAEEAERIASLPKFSVMKVPEFVEAYVANKEVADHEQRSVGIEASTVNNYTYVVRHLCYPELDKPITALKIADVDAWVKATKEAGVGASMRAKAFSMLKYAYKWGMERGYTKAPNPCESVRAPQKLEREKNPLNEAQLARLNTLLDTLDDGESKRALADAVRIALHTGMRQGEICGLRWKDVDRWDDDEAWERPELWNTGEEGEIEGYLQVVNVISDGGAGIGNYNKPYPKGRRKRFIPILPDLARALANRRAEAKQECMAEGVPFTGELYVIGRAVSPEEVGTGFYSPDYLGHQWSMFADLMSIKGRSGARAHFHDLRHTFAVHYLANGIPLATVSSILGHANSQTTARYYEDFLTEKQREAMRKMDSQMGRRATVGKVTMMKPTGTDY